MDKQLIISRLEKALALALTGYGDDCPGPPPSMIFQLLEGADIGNWSDWGKHHIKEIEAAIVRGFELKMVDKN